MGGRSQLETTRITDFGYSELYLGKNNKKLCEKNFDLTKREIGVLFFIAEGLSNVEISKILNISSQRVKSHVINIFNKFGVNNRTQASVKAIRYNII